MARPDKKLGTPDEFELRDDDRPSATGYGYDRRPSRSFALVSESCWSDWFSDTSTMTATRTEGATQQRPRQ